MVALGGTPREGIQVETVMTDTEILDGMEKAGISVWPDRESRVHADTVVSEWNTFCKVPKQATFGINMKRASLRAVLVDTLEELKKRNERPDNK
jgi:hypothetical protein